MDGAYMEDMMESGSDGRRVAAEGLYGESLLMQRAFNNDLEGSGYDMHFTEAEGDGYETVSCEATPSSDFGLPSGYDMETEQTEPTSAQSTEHSGYEVDICKETVQERVVVTVAGDDSNDEEGGEPGKARSATATLVQIEELLTRGKSTGDCTGEHVGADGKRAGEENEGEKGEGSGGRSQKAVQDGDRSARMDWTGEFQEILCMEDAKEKYLALYSLANDFVYAAKTYGKIIISEIHLAQADKTIKSIDAGGVAGGAKYLRHSIFFKLVVDTLLNRKEAAHGEPEVWMYGGSERNDAFAMKAAGHDLQALIAFYNTRCEGVNFPLMAIIDYRGYRLIAMSILPVNGQSLIYGCCDGGKNVYASDPVFNEKMEAMCCLMNLKEHLVMDKTLHCCGDIEGHLGTDGKYYLLDFARLFPPEAPSREHKPKGRSVFYQHLRPEFLMSYEEPLSSDAFSGWGKRDPLTAQHNSAVRRATNHLYNVTIKKFAEHLDSVASDVLCSSFSLTEEMHHAGINVRHLGRLRVHSRHPDVSALLLTEMVARVLKAEINGILRKTMLQSPGNLPLKVPYRDAVLRYFNMLISADPGDMKPAVQFWTGAVKSLIVDKFTTLSLNDWEQVPTWDLRLSIGHHHAYLFRRLIDLTSIRINKKILDDLDNSQHMFDLQFHFISSDIISIGARVKHMNVVDEAEANVLLFDAMNCYGVQAEQVWAVVNRKFNNAMASSTFNFRTLNQWASALFEHASRQLSASAARALLNDAGRKTARVLQMQPTYHPGLFLYGRIMVLQGALCETGSDTQFQCLRAAVQHFIDSIDAHPDNYRRLLQTAKEAYDEAVEMAKVKSHRQRAHRTFLLSSMMYKAASMAGGGSSTLPADSDAEATLEKEENKLLYRMGLSMYQCAAHGPSVSNHFMEGLIMEAAQAIEAYLMLLPVAALADKRFVFCVDQRREDKQLQRTVEVYEKQDSAPTAMGRKASEGACVVTPTGVHYFHRREDMKLFLPARHRVMLSPIYCLCGGSASVGMRHINEVSKWVASEGIGCNLPPYIFDVVLEYHPVDFFAIHEIVLHHPQV